MNQTASHRQRTHQPRAIGYSILLKHDDPADLRQVVDTYFARLTSVHPGLAWGGFIADEQEYHHQFVERPGGWRVIQALRPGDHVIFATAARVCRDVNRLIQIIDALATRGVHTHLADLQICFSTGIGRTILPPLHFVVEQNRQARAEQMRGVVSRRYGAPTRFRKHHGYVVSGPPRQLHKLVDEESRKVLRRIEKLHEEEGLSFQKISDLFESELCLHERRPYKRSAFTRREWGVGKVQRAYLSWRRIQREEGLEGASQARGDGEGDGEGDEPTGTSKQ